MHRLLKSGVPIMRSLSGLQEAAINPEMKRVIGEVRKSLEGGRELSQTLARHPRVFSPFYLSMVRVGEATGLLDEIFFRLFEHLEFERYMREQVKSALRYPSFVVLVMVMALVIVNLFVIPAFAKVFAGFGAELPLLTRVLLGFSDFMVAYWPSLLLGAIGCGMAFGIWLRKAIPVAWCHRLRDGLWHLAANDPGALPLGPDIPEISDCRQNPAQGCAFPLRPQFFSGNAQRRSGHAGLIQFGANGR